MTDAEIFRAAAESIGRDRYYGCCLALYSSAIKGKGVSTPSRIASLFSHYFYRPDTFYWWRTPPREWDARANALLFMAEILESEINYRPTRNPETGRGGKP